MKGDRLIAGLAPAEGLDLGEGGAAVDLRLALAQAIEIGGR
jgi:hypothetical protein